MLVFAILVLPACDSIQAEKEEVNPYLEEISTSTKALVEFAETEVPRLRKIAWRSGEAPETDALVAEAFGNYYEKQGLDGNAVTTQILSARAGHTAHKNTETDSSLTDSQVHYLSQLERLHLQGGDNYSDWTTLRQELDAQVMQNLSAEEGAVVLLISAQMQAVADFLEASRPKDTTVGMNLFERGMRFFNLDGFDRPSPELMKQVRYQDVGSYLPPEHHDFYSFYGGVSEAMGASVKFGTAGALIGAAIGCAAGAIGGPPGCALTGGTVGTISGGIGALAGLVAGAVGYYEDARQNYNNSITDWCMDQKIRQDLDEATNSNQGNPTPMHIFLKSCNADGTVRDNTFMN